MKYLPPNRRGTRLAAALALTAAASLMFAACGGGGDARIARLHHPRGGADLFVVSGGTTRLVNHIGDGVSTGNGRAATPRMLCLASPWQSPQASRRGRDGGP